MKELVAPGRERKKGGGVVGIDGWEDEAGLQDLRGEDIVSTRWPLANPKTISELNLPRS